jgi:DNA mismatch repair protein MutL
MGIIRILPEGLTNKIAAGEVVERPASAVKELIENALDAQATRIAVSIRHGGKSLIRVTDNGLGMDREDALLSVKSHTTSKIREVEDIFSIASLGFRGEALASIAAVSRLTLATRDQSQAAGTEIQLAGGTVEHIREVGIPVGTTVEVIDLFFNTPARKKFLKGERSEHAAIAETITTTSLAHPGVSFKLSRDNEVIFDYPPGSHLKERILQTHYRQWNAHLLPLDASRGGVTLRGYIGRAELARTNRTAQLFFINRRPIKSLPLSYALQRSYEGYLPPGNFPVAIIMLTIDPALVDVNVHPTKREVRLQDERFVFDQLTHAVRELLHQADHAPSISFTYTLDKNKRNAPGTAGARSYGPVKEGITPGETRGYPGAGQGTLPLQRAEEPPDTFAAHRGEPTLTVKALLGQIGLSYIIAETDEGLIILDQHAAHERIIFEEILAAMESRVPATQPLLFPATLELGFKEAQLLEEYLPLLAGSGFVIRHLGGHTYCVDAAPAWLNNRGVSDIISDFLHQVMEGRQERSLQDRRENTARILACKTRTVKANESLSREEMEHLIRRLEQAKIPFTCPHGRPTFIKLSLVDLDKQFKRK